MYGTLTIRMFHSMGASVFFSLTVSILCGPILLLLSNTRTCAERRQPCAQLNGLLCTSRFVVEINLVEISRH